MKTWSWDANGSPVESEIIDHLTLCSIKHNYPLFVASQGAEKADEGMARLFGATWDSCKEKVWQWWDEENGLEQQRQNWQQQQQQDDDHGLS